MPTIIPISEGIGSSETVAPARVVSNTATAVETLTRGIIAATRTLLEAAAAHETLAAGEADTRSLSEAATAHETLTAAAAATRSFSEAATAHETVASGTALTRPLLEATTAHDTVIASPIATRPLLEAVSAHETVAAGIIAATRTFREIAAASEHVVTGFAGVNARGLTDRLSVQESLRETIASVRSLLEITTAADLLDPTLAIIGGRAVDEILTVTDTLVPLFLATGVTDAPIVQVSIEQYFNLITAEHNQRARFMATVALSLTPYVSDENLALSLPGLFDIDIAVGQQLDFIGQWVGLTRYISAPTSVWFSLDTRNIGFDQGKWLTPYETGIQTIRLDDEPYRTVLRARIVANSWDGTIPGAYQAWNTLFEGTGYKILIQDGLPSNAREFALDDPTGGFNRSFWYQIPVIEPIYFSLDDASLGFDTGYWLGPPGTTLTIPPPRVHGSMHLIEALLGPPLDDVTKALFAGGYLGLKSAGVQIDYMTQVQPPLPPEQSGDSGVGLPLFAFDTGPNDLGWWMSYDNPAAGLDEAPLFYPGAHPVDPNFAPPYLTLDGNDPDTGLDAGWWTPAVRPDYFNFDDPDPVHGLDAANWFTPGASWWDGTPYPPPPDPDQPLPPTGVTFPPTALAGFDLGAWGATVGSRYA